MRGQVRSFIELLLEEEVEAALGRERYQPGAISNGRRYGHRSRQLVTTFGRLTLSVPRARLAADDLGKREWKSGLLPPYRRLSRRSELLIAEVYLAGVNTRRVRRALQALLAGRIGKDAVSRAWRRTRSAWEAWQQRDLADDDIVRLILDGTVVKVRLDCKALGRSTWPRPPILSSSPLAHPSAMMRRRRSPIRTGPSSQTPFPGAGEAPGGAGAVGPAVAGRGRGREGSRSLPRGRRRPAGHG